MYLLQLVICEADKHHIVRPAAVHQGGNAGIFTTLTVEQLPVCFLLHHIVAAAKCCKGHLVCRNTAPPSLYFRICGSLVDSHKLREQ